MKRYLLFVLFLSAFGANAQQKPSLRDLLYSGKLKMDSNTVIRKGDDLSARIDTSTAKAAEPEKPVVKPALVDSGSKTLSATDTPNADTKVVNARSIKETAAPAKSNTKIWKDYTDSLITTLNTEVLPSKKIKKGTYYLMVEYEIGTDGNVGILNLVSTPENAFLQEQVKNRLTLSAPQLQPVLDSTNKPRKVKRKYNFNVTKE